MEVLTLQFGHFANHVGAHYWNFQDEEASQDSPSAAATRGGDPVPEVDFARLYAEFSGRCGPQWCPRLIVVDKKGALGACRTSDTYVAASASSAARADAQAVDSRPMAFGDNSGMGFKLENFESEAWALHPFQQDLELEEQHAEVAWADGAANADWQMADYDEQDCDDDFEQGGVTATNQVVAPAVPSVMQTAAAYDFGHTVRTWTDYLKIRLRDSSVRELQSCAHGTSPFSTFFDGIELRDHEDVEEVLDRMRRQVELCDQLDAVHVIYDMHDGFGGLTSLAMDWLREEVPKCGKLAAAVQPPDARGDTANSTGASVDIDVDAPSVAPMDTESCAWVGAAFSFAHCASAGLQVWTPAAVPLWSANPHPALFGLNRGSMYETSAAIATALDVATLPYRLKGGPRPSSSLTSFAPSERPVCGLRVALPLPPPALLPGLEWQGATPAGLLSPFFFDLSDMAPKPGNPYSSVVLRGAEPSRLVALCEALHPRARRCCYASPASLRLPLPFPQFFGPRVSRKGIFAESGHARPADIEVEECPVATHLHAAAQAGRCGPLQRMNETMRAKRHSAWAASMRSKYGIEADEFSEVLETVRDHLECGAASQSGSDSGSD